MNFIPRDTAPSKTNKFYYSNMNTYYKNGVGMPNCTAYAYGRGLELTDGKANLPKAADAHNWYGITKGYTKDKTPSLGAIVCFEGGNRKKGHVAVVEYIYTNGDIKTSNSAYKGTNFYMQTIHPPYNFSNYTLQGFIHIIDTEPSPTPTPTEFNIGDEVIVSGNLYKSSNATSPAGYVSKRRTKITRKVIGAKHPYNTTGDLGWCDASSLTKYETPKTFNIGDNVIVTGYLYKSSNALKPSGSVKNRKTTITRKVAGAKHPYNTTGDLGWCDESSLTKI